MSKHTKNERHTPATDAAGWNVVTNTGKIVEKGFPSFALARVAIRKHVRQHLNDTYGKPGKPGAAMPILAAVRA